MSFVPARGLTKAETAALASIPDLPAAAMAILAETAEARVAAPKTIGPERGAWFQASSKAFDAIKASRVDYRWGRNMHRVRVPASFTLYRDRNGAVKVGNREQMVPAPDFWPKGRFPAGVVDLGPAARA